MTEKECLQKMVALWGYLADNPDMGKEDAYNELELAGDMNQCPCCEYAYQQNDWHKSVVFGEMCVRCPLKDFWPNGKCSSKGSSYMKWFKAKKIHVKQGAIFAILNASIQKLMEIKG